MSSNKEEFSLTVFFKRPAAGTLKLHSFELKLIANANVHIPHDYLQKIDREIQFLWEYCPLHTEHEFANLILLYIYTESRFKVLTSSPFTEVSVQIEDRTYKIDSLPHYEKEKTKFGNVDILFSNTIFGVYRLRIAPHRSIPSHKHTIMKEKEIILSDHLLLDAKAIKAGTIKIWDHNVSHCYENPAEYEGAILCIDEPPFDANDEILV